jgi:hypothetical protein
MSIFEKHCLTVIEHAMNGCSQCADAWDALQAAIQHATTRSDGTVNGDGA